MDPNTAELLDDGDVLGIMDWEGEAGKPGFAREVFDYYLACRLVGRENGSLHVKPTRDAQDGGERTTVPQHSLRRALKALAVAEVLPADHGFDLRSDDCPGLFVGAAHRHCGRARCNRAKSFCCLRCDQGQRSCGTACQGRATD